MADLITTYPLTIRRSQTAGVKAPKRGIGAVLVALSKAVGQVFELAYAAPYNSGQRQDRNLPAEDLEGRDPCW